ISLAVRVRAFEGLVRVGEEEGARGEQRSAARAPETEGPREDERDRRDLGPLLERAVRGTGGADDVGDGEPLAHGDLDRPRRARGARLGLLRESARERV